MRALIAFLLCLIVAFQGVASAHVLHVPCPMEQGGHGHGVTMAADAGDCCNDADTAARTGELCKTSVQCGASAAFALPSFPVVLPLTPGSGLVTAVQSLSSSSDPAGIWRPPTLG